MEIGPYPPRFYTQFSISGIRLEGPAKNPNLGNFGLEHPQSGLGAGLPPQRRCRADLGLSGATRGGEPEVARNRVVGGEEARELWLMVALWTKSGIKGNYLTCHPVA